MSRWDGFCVCAVLFIDLLLKVMFQDPGDTPLGQILKLDLYFAGLIWMPFKAFGWALRRR
jgi:hypothetical protein